MNPSPCLASCLGALTLAFASSPASFRCVGPPAPAPRTCAWPDGAAAEEGGPGPRLGGPQQRGAPAEPLETAMNFMLLQGAVKLQSLDTQQNSSSHRNAQPACAGCGPGGATAVHAPLPRPHMPPTPLVGLLGSTPSRPRAAPTTLVGILASTSSRAGLPTLVGILLGALLVLVLVCLCGFTRRGGAPKEPEERPSLKSAPLKSAQTTDIAQPKKRSAGELLQAMDPSDLGAGMYTSPQLRQRQPDAPKWSSKSPYDRHLCEELVVQEDKAFFHFYGSAAPAEGVGHLELATTGGEVLLRASCVRTRAGQEIIVRRGECDTPLAYVEVVFIRDELGHEVNRKMEIVTCYRIGGQYNPTFAHIEQEEVGSSSFFHVRRGHHAHGGDKMLAIKRTVDEALMSFYDSAPLSPEEEEAIQIKVANLAPEKRGDAEELYWQMQARARLLANLEDFGSTYTACRRVQARRGADMALIFCAAIGVYKFDH